MKEIFTPDNMQKLEEHFKGILSILDNPERPGLVETPKRVAKMYAEMFEGQQYTNSEIAQMFNKCFEDVDCKDLVVEKDIQIFSHCEHHIALMYDMTVAVGYIPKDKVIGISKIARIADMVAKRLQLQEKIGEDIYQVLSEVLGTNDIIIVIEGSHACMTARGIKSRNAKTKTAVTKGKFREFIELRNEFYSLID